MDAKVLQMNIRANMLRITELLQSPNILNKEIEVKSKWDATYTYNTFNGENVELRQRMKMLRKELNQLNKVIEGVL